MCKERVTLVAKPITKIEHDVLNSTLRSLGDAGGTTEHLDWMRGRGHAKLLIRFVDEQRTLLEQNPYEMSVQKQIDALRDADHQEKWGVPEENFIHLAATALAWPQGKRAYRSFRIRFGEGSEGVQQTFEHHVDRIKSVFGRAHFRRWGALRPGEVPCNGELIQALRLLNGDATHKAVVEWVIVDLGTHRKRKSIKAVRGVKSLADELLVIAWMFPNMIRDMDEDILPGLFAAGYEFTRLGKDGKLLEEVPVIYSSNPDELVNLGASDCSYDNDHYSVPELLG